MSGRRRNRARTIGALVLAWSSVSCSGGATEFVQDLAGSTTTTPTSTSVVTSSPDQTEPSLSSEPSATTETSTEVSEPTEPGERAPDPAASPGCRMDPPPAVDRYLTMTAGDELRVALVHTPPGYQAGVAAPLLIDFHGYGGTSERTQADHDFDPLADAAGVITVYPQGLELDVELTGWYTISREDQSDDVAYVAQLLDALERQLCVDPDRVWAVGHSVGGGMADYVACELAHRFTAVAIVAGTFYPRDRCEPAEPTAILEVHSTTDDVAPYYGRPYFVSVEAWFAAWADRLHCDPDPSDDGGRVVWNGCDAPLEHVRLEGVGHDWISAETALVWEFLQRAGTRTHEP